MREIKFRAWNPELRKMLYEIEEINISGDNVVGEIKHGVLEVRYMKESGLWVDAPVMQYTGLKDRNGKEIYDGDITETCHHIYDGDKTTRNVIEFKDFCWKLVAIGNNWLSDITLRVYASQPETIEVIGNIYENPELLETQGNK